MSLTHSEIIAIMKLFRESKFHNLYLESDDFKLALSKDGQNIAGQNPAEPTSPASRPMNISIESKDMAQVEPPRPGASPSIDLDLDQLERDGLEVFKSPMLGVFYRAPQPGADPFVSEGVVVDEGNTLCIIEVMKLYSSIVADTKAEIVKILVEDGDMVEYDQPLFLIKPVAKAGGK